MANETSSGKWYDKIKEFEKNVTAPFLQVLVDLWVPAFIAVLSLIFFSFDPTHQILDIYRVFALNPNQEGWRIFYSFISIFILSLLIWYSGRNLLEKKKEKPNDSQPLSHEEYKKYKESLRLAKEWLPRFFGFLPLVALSCGLFRSSHGISEAAGGLIFQLLFALVLFVFYWIFVSFRFRETSPVHREPLLFSSGFLLFLNCLSIIVVSIFTFPLVNDNKWIKLLVIIFMLFLQYLLSWFLSRESNSSNNVNIFRNPFQFFKFLFKLEGVKKEKKIIWIFLLLSAFFLSLVAYSPFVASNPVASTIGSVSVIALFLMVCVFWGSLLFDYGDTTGIPFVVILLILALVFSGFDWNDNHHLRELSSKPPVKIEDLETSFNKWIHFKPRQKEITKFNNEKPYPIYIVSAQGGGITTAYHAALTLSRLQDSCPGFASHVFAISGVSGGSVGASVFSSLVKQFSPPATNDNNCLEKLPTTAGSDLMVVVAA